LETPLLRSLYLAAKPFHVGVDVDGLVCPLHHPTVCSRQTRGSFLFGAAISHHAVVGGSAFLGGARPPGLDI
jgi:hypothetical protein